MEETLDEMTKRLEAAGMNKLIESKQEQLDKWLSEQ